MDKIGLMGIQPVLSYSTHGLLGPHVWFNTLLALFFFFFFLLILLFRTVPVAYGSSQARGHIRAAAAGLYHSHSNMGSKPHL